MKKKYIIITICILILIGIFTSLILLNRKVNKFYLDDKYYNEGNYIKIDSLEFDKIKNQSYVLFTYNNFCHLQIPCDQVFLKVMKKYKIDFLSMEYSEYKKTYLHDKVKFAPTIIVVNNGKIVAYLDSEKDSDLNKYQNEEAFDNWISQYIYTKK